MGAIVAIVIVLIVVGGTAAIVMSYYRLQRHRADAVAMAAYRQLAEQAVSNQELLRDELSQLTERVGEVEKMMREVG